MKKTNPVLAFAAAGVLLAGCKSEYIVGKDIKEEQFREFYYTVSNINYNAFYQRYHVFVEDGRHMFFHETRKRENDYGPATEKDTVLKGTFELSEEEWETVFGFLKNGTVIKRQEHTGSGDSGPWTYLYWTGDKDTVQEFSFASWDTQKTFETYCAELASRDAVSSPDLNEDGFYIYPVTAASDEWDTLSDEEKIRACLIREDIRKSMSDDALVRAVADYPLLEELYYYDDPEYAAGFFPDDCSAYGEILKREDPGSIMLKGMRELPSSGDPGKDRFTRDSLSLLVLFDKQLDGSFTGEEAAEIAGMSECAVIVSNEEAYDYEFDFSRAIQFKDGTEAAVLWFADGRP